MSEPTATEPERHLWLVRHGETEWARLGRHTGRTDIPLTDVGRDQARALGERLAGRRFARIVTSPLLRAADTAALSGVGDAAADDDLMEWDYGDLEGRTTPDIRGAIPEWSIWRGPWPGGETLGDVAARADRVLARWYTPDLDGDVLVFSHGHMLRILAARWLRLPASAGSMFALSTATVNVLGWDRDNPVIEVWNEGALR